MICNDEVSSPPAAANELHDRDMPDDTSNVHATNESGYDRKDDSRVIPLRRNRRRRGQSPLMPEAFEYAAEDFTSASRTATYIPEGVDLDRLARIF
ncbi:hypothetical protein HDU96_003431, partial [Phlyctochytrium bullatum]